MKNVITISKAYSALKKPFMMMKLTVVLVVFCCMQSLAGVNAQTITLNADNKAITQVLTSIEKQAGYRFFFDSRLKDLKQTVSLAFTDALLADVLKKLFAGTSLTFQDMGNNLIAIKSLNNADITVTGKVMDLNGSGVAGASVLVKGGTVGTETDGNGNFSITVADNATLVISAVGYITQEIPVNQRAEITVVLSLANQSLEEVVVIGYGTQRKIDNTGSVASVKGEDLAKQANNNPIASLQGRVAGVTIVNSGAPGSTPTVRIRGVNSTGNGSPLYVVDGIFQQNINYLNPGDIESINVLKDPSSISIFGLQGGNGVIVVTTKRALAGKTRVNFISNTGISVVNNKIDVTDAAGFKQLYDQQLANLNAAPFDYRNYTANTNWQDELLRTGFFNNNSLTFSNATAKATTLLNIGYNNETGVVKNGQFERFIMRLNQEVRIAPAFRVGGEVTGYFSNSKGATGSIINALRSAPIVPVRAANGLYYSMPSFQRAQVGNPVATLELNDNTAINRSYRAVGNLFAEVKFLKDFTFKSTFYGDLLFSDGRDYTPLPNRFINLGEGAIQTDTSFNSTQRTSVSQSQSITRRFQQDHILNWNKKFAGGHDLTLLAGVTSLFIDGSNINGNRRDTSLNIPNNPNYYYINIVSPDNPGSYGGGGSVESFVGYLSRANYSYQSKYLLNASFRRDGNSKFAPQNRYQNYASVGAGWVISKEKFFGDVKVLDYLKLRGSYGTVGNGLGLGQNLYLPGLRTSDVGIFGENIYPSVVPAFVASEDLKAEVVVGKDLGLEWRMLKNKLSGELTFYDRTTKDIITNLTLPNSNLSLVRNSGDISNRGVELSLGWNDKIGNDFSYSINANGSYNKNKVVAIGEGFDFVILGNGGVNRTVAGQSIGYFYGYRQAGIYQSTADIAKQPALANSLPGDIAYEDIDGDGKITPADRTNLGSPLPKYNFGGEVSAAYKGFDLSIAVNGVAGNKIYTERRTATFATLNYETNRLDAWTAPGTTNIEPILDQTRGNNFLFSSYYLEKGDYFRLRNIQLGYNFGNNVAKRLGAETLRLSVSAQNLATFSYATGYSPEVSISNPIAGGADNGSYPVPTVYTVGVNLVF